MALNPHYSVGKAAWLLRGSSTAVYGSFVHLKPAATCPRHQMQKVPKEIFSTTPEKTRDDPVIHGACKMCLGRPVASSGLGVTSTFRYFHSRTYGTDRYSVRHAHTDVKIPNFDSYRLSDGKDPKKKNEQQERGLYHYLWMAQLGALSAIAGRGVCEVFIKNMSASADVMALAKIEVKLDAIPEGKNVTFTWRGKPLFVKHRTEKEISDAQKTDVSKLRDPEKDEDRVIDPRFLVVIGICTHLGCVPIANAGDFGAYYCPCHGSHYDHSGRIRKGPAPLNLEVPSHEINGDLLVVG